MNAAASAVISSQHSSEEVRMNEPTAIRESNHMNIKVLSETGPVRAEMQGTSLRFYFLLVLLLGLYDRALHGSSLRTVTIPSGGDHGFTTPVHHQQDQEFADAFLVANAKRQGAILLDSQTWRQVLEKGLSAALKGGSSGFVAGIIQVRSPFLNEQERVTKRAKKRKIKMCR